MTARFALALAALTLVACPRLDEAVEAADVPASPAAPADPAPPEALDDEPEPEPLPLVEPDPAPADAGAPAPVEPEPAPPADAGAPAPEPEPEPEPEPLPLVEPGDVCVSDAQCTGDLTCEPEYNKPGPVLTPMPTGVFRCAFNPAKHPEPEPEPAPPGVLPNGSACNADELCASGICWPYHTQSDLTTTGTCGDADPSGVSHFCTWIEGACQAR